MKLILVVNAGSSSLKYQLIDMTEEKLLAKGLVERIGIEGSNIKQTVFKGEEKIAFSAEQPMKDHTDGIKLMLQGLLDPEKGAIRDMKDIYAVGHRVLHGGRDFTASVQINEEVKSAIRANIPLGPLHNPANLMGIEAVENVMPETPNVAVFDTAFGANGLEKKAYLYGIPLEYYEKLGVRRYGFHGTSHRYIGKRACEFLGLDPKHSRIISCHLGNGSSIAAIENGKCKDTSMGLAPLPGLLMGTRCGDIDPTIVQFLCNNVEGMTVDSCLNMLNKKSGLLGITGFSSDMRDVIDTISGKKPAEKPEDLERATLARDMWVWIIRKYIGSYVAEMNGVDAIVFTAGIGENNPGLRELIMDGFDYLGVKLDAEANNTRDEAVISAPDSKVLVASIPTNEELMIARDTLAIVEGKKITD